VRKRDKNRKRKRFCSKKIKSRNLLFFKRRSSGGIVEEKKSSSEKMDLEEEMDVDEHFKGCLRELHINGQRIPLTPERGWQGWQVQSTAMSIFMIWLHSDIRLRRYGLRRRAVPQRRRVRAGSREPFRLRMRLSAALRRAELRAPSRLRGRRWMPQ